MKSKNYNFKSINNPSYKIFNNKDITKTFSYKGLKIKLHPEVYDPAEDTFLLLKSIKINEGETVFEIGTGCGIIALECARLGANVVCSDINPYSIKITAENYDINRFLLKGSVNIRYGDLFSAIKKNEKFDVIIFNPPYLPTKLDDRIGDTGWIDIAIDGGKDGITITKKFIDGLNKHIRKSGRAYFVFSSLCDRKKLENFINRYGLKSNIESSLSFNDEKIDIYCIYF